MVRPIEETIGRRSTPELAPVQVPQVYEQVEERIVQAILEGNFQVARRLPSERELARSFQVGRPSVREALASLQIAGVLETRPGSGSVVSPDAFDKIADRGDDRSRHADVSPFAVLEARAVFEPAMARLAAAVGLGDTVIERELERQEGLTSFEDPVQRGIWSDSDRIFHRQIAVITGNALFISLYDHIASIMSETLWRELRDRIVSSIESTQLYASQHRLIYEAIVAGDEEGAAYFASQHLRHVRAEMEREDEE